MRLRFSSTLFSLTFLSHAICSASQINRIPNEWIIKLRPGISLSSARSALYQHRLVRAFGPEKRFVLLRGGKPQREALPDEVLSIQPNYRYSAFDETDSTPDPDLNKCWGLINEGQVVPDGVAGIVGKDISAKAAWALQASSPNITVAIVDSGLTVDHEDLSANVWTNPREVANNNIDDDGNGYVDDIHGWNFVSGSNNVNDDHDHGSFCAGIIGAQSENGKGARGVTARVKMMPVKSLDENGFGSTANAISAIEYAVNNGADIINASWGGSSYDQALYDMVKWAGTKGVLFVAASGNDGLNNDTDPLATYPASFKLPNVISVAAYDNQDRIASFSNFGKTTVDVGAPGVKIYSTSNTSPGYRYGDGTSFSAPYVSGVAALLKAHVPTISVTDLKERLVSTSDVIGYYQKEKTKSAGRVNAYQALLNVRPPRPVAPTDWKKVFYNAATTHPYANSMDESYTFTSEGATHIRVHFTQFETEGCCDHVTARDQNGNVVDIYSGSLNDFTSADALGESITLELKSDSTMTKFGFAIDYYEVSQSRDLWWETRRDLLPPPPWAKLWDLLPGRTLALRSGMRSPFQRLAPNLN